MEKTRRKVLKASAAAPLVLTVPTASATALTSMTCRDRDAKLADPNHILASPGADEWLRKKIDIVELEIYDWKQKTWNHLKDRRFFLGMNNYYWELDPTNPWSATATQRYEKRLGVREKSRVGERDALVYVATDGQVVGMAWQKYGGTKIMKSCWCSMNPQYGGKV